MGNPDMGGYTPESEQNELSAEISKRASSASEKIKKRVSEVLIPNINQMGSDAERWIYRLQNDFYALVENPDDECGGGNYKGWTAKEIKELYSVLYGEEMD